MILGVDVVSSSRDLKPEIGGSIPSASIIRPMCCCGCGREANTINLVKGRFVFSLSGRRGMRRFNHIVSFDKTFLLKKSFYA
jgi:hypothetical protein